MIAEESAGAVAATFNVEAVESCHCGFGAVGFGEVEPFCEAYHDAVEFTAVTAGFAVPISDVLPWNKLHH